MKKYHYTASKKTFTKLSALALASAISFAPAFPAWAAAGGSSSAGSGNSAGSVTASAALVDQSKTGSLTIHKYDITSAEADGAYSMGSQAATGSRNQTVENALADYEIEGVEFSYLRIGDAETHSTSGNGGSRLELVYEIPKELADILKLSPQEAVDMTGSGEAKPCSKSGIYHYTAAQISKAMETITSADNVSAKNALENYLKASSESKAMPKTDADGQTAVDGLALGLYLVVETEVPENVTDTVNPWFVQLPFTNADGSSWLYDMTCYPKDQTGNPTLEKMVKPKSDLTDNSYGDTAAASEGDILDYILVSKLPHISSGATYLSEYTFEDRLSAGLSYNRDVQIALYTNAEDAENNRVENAAALWTADGGKFTQIYTENADETGGSMLTVSMQEAGLEELNSSYSDCYMVVFYTAVLHADDSAVLGDEGNPNDVQLTWSRTSSGYYDTLEDHNTVYTYGIDLTKYFSDDKGDFSKVKFLLKNTTEGYYVTAEKQENGSYYVTGQAKDQTGACSFVPDSSGKLLISGLEADAYELTETATADGYSLLKEPVSIEITQTTEEAGAEAFVDGKTAEMTQGDASVLVSVTNSKNLILPQTGGNGLYAVTIAGMVTAAGGCLLLTRKKKDA